LQSRRRRPSADRRAAAVRRASRQLARVLDPPEPPKLRYVSDSHPGISRRRVGSGFRYVDADGRTVGDPAELRRIRSIAIPPAWADVWICPRADGHLQAVGRDARGRKQYRYHPAWREFRERDKYGRMLAFGRALPRIRGRVARDLARSGLPREKVLAAVVDLLQATDIRIGNEEYARENQSYGLTTLRDRHVRVSGSEVRFRFRGKSGKVRDVVLSDPRAARLVKRFQDLPGQELFQYVDDGGELRSIDSGDVNDYLREISGEEFSAKDFRTWAGSVLTACALRELRCGRTRREANRNLVRAIDVVAERLGNTRAVCRRSYVHPAVIDTYLEGRVIADCESRGKIVTHRRTASLSPDEKALLALLREATRQLESSKRRGRKAGADMRRAGRGGSGGIGGAQRQSREHRTGPPSR
jgi:DNA topoisomerase-1